MPKTCPHCFGRLFIWRNVGKNAAGEPLRDKIPCHCVVRRQRAEAQKKLIIKPKDQPNVEPTNKD